MSTTLILLAVFLVLTLLMLWVGDLLAVYLFGALFIVMAGAAGVTLLVSVFTGVPVNWG
jgi:hypothetical protein